MVVNDCQMMTHHYDLKDEELESFKIYLDQLGKYYNASLLRFYGICVKASNQYVVIMDYKPRSIQYMIDNCQFIDEIQVATIMLQLLYSINFLHTHD
jgi:serine/threonine protein kinase